VGPLMIVDSSPFVGQYFASAMVSMISPESCSLLIWALKDSMKPFCQGDPGSTNAVSTLRPTGLRGAALPRNPCRVASCGTWSGSGLGFCRPGVRMPPRISHRHAHSTVAGYGAQNFPFATSPRMSMASSFSASRRLNRAFSFSSSFVRLDASAAFLSGPYWFSQRYQVASVI
jgi:hypothetical protein